MKETAELELMHDIANPLDTLVIPRFCFICGEKLVEVGLGWLQCNNNKCGECFLPYIDGNNNQCLMHQWNTLWCKNVGITTGTKLREQ